MTDSQPPDDNVVSFDSFKRKESSKKYPPKKKGHKPAGYLFKIEPGRVIECTIHAKTDGGYMVKVDKDVTAFLSTEKIYRPGSSQSAQIICEKDGYLLLGELESEDSEDNVVDIRPGMFDSQNSDPENCIPLRPKNEEEPE